LVVVQVPAPKVEPMVDLVVLVLGQEIVATAEAVEDIREAAVDSTVLVVVDLVVLADPFHLSDSTGLELMQLLAS
jgi:hypothetical protein